MKLRKNTILTVCLILAVTLVISGCSGGLTPYEKNDAENYNISVKFDANGGLFTTNTAVMVDSFNASGMKTNASGEVEIALLSPDDSQRGREAFAAYNSGHFLAGWYAERTETKNENGETQYSYSKKWDFAKDRVTVSADGDYSAAEPVVTLYAVWLPLFEVEYCDKTTGKLLSKETFNPTTSDAIVLPEWNERTGKLDLNDIPKNEGYTFANLYLNQDDTEPVTGESVAHCGTVNYDNCTVSNPTMKLYVEWTEGEWFHIYTAKQFVKLAESDGNYVICADLDFSDEKWPKELNGDDFTGTIMGNGFTFSGISVSKDTSLFATIQAGASITDLNVEISRQNVGNNVKFADEIVDGAVISNVQVTVDGSVVYPE